MYGTDVRYAHTVLVWGGPSCSLAKHSLGLRGTIWYKADIVCVHTTACFPDGAEGIQAAWQTQPQRSMRDTCLSTLIHYAL